VLYARRSGRGDPVVLLHGFTQSSATWGRVAAALAREHEVIALDAPGHGRSADVHADLRTGADLMVKTVRRPAPNAAGAWVGYSMGGRFALHVALRHPSAVRRLVLVSATAGIDDPAERERRRHDDDSLARRVLSEGLEPFVRWWVSQPLFATLPARASDIETRLGGTAEGLASSLRLAGTGSQDPLWDSLASLGMPVLVVAGGDDTKYLALARRMVDAIGANATLETIAGAGHACHLERPGQFLAAVVPFISG
jgi:2-succinyl-6-hydroxy-2,4-cyclohexadiene-1-carboxylate synthase